MAQVVKPKVLDAYAEALSAPRRRVLPDSPRSECRRHHPPQRATEQLLPWAPVR